jgi:hypothetical protein
LSKAPSSRGGLELEARLHQEIEQESVEELVEGMA